MGPLFVLLIMATLAGMLFVCAFGILLFKFSIRLASAVAISFAGGAVLSLYPAIFAASPFVGETTFQSRFAVCLFLAWLASAGIAGGIVAAFFALRLIRHRRSKALLPPLQ
ncbi:hypothetical protein [Bradyrhizobium sp. CCBAU 53421]|uniref:hypothetical protein n=1 Tax=Bradyrhizobium sp. CCBAU 53421 TaxID=1325120 RepID=UPI00188A8A3D|nr:hypothetical protein [Bradyrhizobium sp. CCBAU 53421]QOZ33139.1 hypothetical protein XH92_16885 [Bradyrhizobium sp. CCBAU 53421]